ncbi:hypothetical protein BgiMline_023861, partial [Biomphalaria glabrata]
ILVLFILNILEGVRVLILPLVLLLFPEVRGQALQLFRFLRPKTKPALTFTYTKEV